MILEFDGYRPSISPSAFVAPTAVLVGNVTVGDEASVWYGAVLRGDRGECGIVIGPRSSVQENAVIHVALDRGTTIGAEVTVGHGALLEGCEIEDGCVVGMNAVILEGARLGARSLLAASSTVLPGVQLPPHSVAAGSPAVVKKRVSGGSTRWIEGAARHYVELSRRYREQGLDGPH
jgi:carbonic anhydrase/acetyltransferase-like protein (isoleucine patch superfamily)